MKETEPGAKAFGVEEGYAPYRLRQARYYELGVECASWAKTLQTQTGRNLQLLDVGTYDGVIRKYIEVHSGAEHIEYSAVDRYPKGREFVYKHESWNLHQVDLENGMEGLTSDAYDVVVCEQVLEHLHHPEHALADIYRVTKPGGRMIIGVPIFPPGLDLVRKHVVPKTDELFQVKKVRGHVQAWTQGSFVRLIKQICPEVKIEVQRGFRLVSGGVLRPLEYSKWWWQLNRKIGTLVPGYCREIQIVAQKPAHCSRQRETRCAA